MMSEQKHPSAEAIIQEVRQRLATYGEMTPAYERPVLRKVGDFTTETKGAGSCCAFDHYLGRD